MSWFYSSIGSSSSMFGIAVYGKNGKYIRPLFNVIRKLERLLIWEPRYRFSKAHQYHLVRTGLKPGYYDVDERMLHANMALLVGYVEREQGGAEKLQDRVKWLQEHNLGAAVGGVTEDNELNGDAEALRIYLWWTQERAVKRKVHEDAVTLRYSNTNLVWENEEGEDDLLRLANIDTSKVPVEALTIEQLTDMDIALEKEDEDNLVTLMRIRRQLWT